MTRLRSFGWRALVPILALVTALGFGALVIIFTDFANLQRIGTDPLGAIGGAASGVVTGYGAGDQVLARLGVLGPTRMDYPTAMGAVRAVARYVGQILAES